MKKNTLILLLLAIPLLLQAQEKFINCPVSGTYNNTNRSLEQSRNFFKSATLVDSSIIEFPIVFHLMHLGDPIGQGANLTDQQIINVVKGINETYRGRGGWSSAANLADTKIRFKLVKKDINGNACTGINRIDCSSNLYYKNNGIKYQPDSNDFKVFNLSKWDYKEYINIYVVTGILNAGGFADLGPIMYQNTGVVLRYDMMGDADHELSHIIGLTHADMRLDSIPGLFSKTPTKVLRSLLSKINVPNLLNSSKIYSLNANDIGILDNYFSGNICSGVLYPELLVSNYGNNNVTTFNIKILLDGIQVLNYNFNGSISMMERKKITLPQMPLIAVGNHSIEIISSLPNGQPDSDPFNDRLKSNFSILPVLPVNTYTQNFDGDSSLIHKDMGLFTDFSTIYIKKNTGVGGSTAIEMAGKEKVTTTIVTDYPNMSKNGFNVVKQYTSKLAFCISSAANNNRLKMKYDRKQIALDSAFHTGFRVTINGIPLGKSKQGNSNWTSDFVDLSSYSGKLIVGLEGNCKTSSANGNAVYIDNLQISDTLVSGISDINSTKSEIFIFPNPSSGIINIQSHDNENCTSGSLYNISGQVVQQIHKINSSNDIVALDISGNISGVYYLRLNTSNGLITKKVVLVKQD